MDLNIQSRIGYGCVCLSSQTYYHQSIKLLETAFASGIRYFDTAPLYGQGYSELILSQFIKDKRKEVIIATKFGLGISSNPTLRPSIALPLNAIKKRFFNKFILRSQYKADSDFSNKRGQNKYTINKYLLEEYLEKSLLRLGTDYIDVYLLHENVPTALDSPCIEYLLSLKKEGVVKSIGIASSSDMIRAVLPEEINQWDILQYEYGLDNKRPDLKVRFPNFIHSYHGVLRCLKNISRTKYSHGELAGMLIASVLLADKEGRVLFSSNKPQNIRDNILFAEKYFREPELIPKNLTYELY